MWEQPSWALCHSPVGACGWEEHEKGGLAGRCTVHKRGRFGGVVGWVVYLGIGRIDDGRG